MVDLLTHSQEFQPNSAAPFTLIRLSVLLQKLGSLFSIVDLALDISYDTTENSDWLETLETLREEMVLQVCGILNQSHKLLTLSRHGRMEHKDHSWQLSELSYEIVIPQSAYRRAFLLIQIN